MTSDYVPVIDLGAGTEGKYDPQSAVSAAVAEACRTSGFFVIVGHGVPGATVTQAYGAFQEFFRSDHEFKAAVSADSMDPLFRGYIPGERHEQFYANRLGELTDVEEARTLNNRLCGTNRWPTVPGLRQSALAYYEAMEQLAGRLIEIFARILDVAPEVLHGFFDQHMSPLVCNYYSPQPVPPPRGSLRNEKHRDWCAFTILFQDNSPGGLQVQYEKDVWIDVPHVPDSFVVNLGQIMTLWSGGRLASTVHRVVNPSRMDAHSDRISIPFFAHPNPNLPLRPLEADVSLAHETAGEFHIRMADLAQQWHAVNGYY
ncbi:2OG-Fe(II) oxygenase family protein [Streptomyces sp. W16]|uniref:isopenicillin N synthase family dioxygenase n=1 Tax=Streptomyces sp. W16 TaxID=3076631 RepID=UPI00295AF7F3|nr:2OG-Fe(II) oxygenase family protein [Streptomyces sp. W16]MDV9169309.1 2OG-Fe(II) oxygenase family protein [Streptomyces sp. W16]